MKYICFTILLQNDGQVSIGGEGESAPSYVGQFFERRGSNALAFFSRVVDDFVRISRGQCDFRALRHFFKYLCRK